APWLGVGGQRQAAAGEMAEGAATRCRRKRSGRAVGSIGDIFPLSVTQLLVVRAEAFLLPHHEYRRERVRNETAVGVKNRTSVRVLLHGVRLKENDGSVGEIPGRPGIYRSCDAVAPHDPDLPILEIVKCVKFRERVPVSRREAHPVDGWGG